MPRMVYRADPQGPVYVMAQDYAAFEAWCRASGRPARQALFCPQAIYVHKASKLQGAPHGLRVAFTEGWENHPKATELFALLLAVRAVRYDSGAALLSGEAPGSTADTGNNLDAISQTVVNEAWRSPGWRPRTPRLPSPSGWHPMPGCSCPWCQAQRDDISTTPDDVGADRSLVYLADGTRAGGVVTMLNDTDTFECADYDASRVMHISRYTIVSRSVCDIAHSAGIAHQYQGEVCERQLRLGFITPGTLFAPNAQRALDRLYPQWRAVMPLSPTEDSTRRFQELTSQYTPPPVFGRPNPYLFRNYTVQGVDAPVATFVQPEAPVDDGTRPFDPYELNWPAPEESRRYGTVCSHICGDDHVCEARATTVFSYTIPTGGVRKLPVCETCHAAETQALAAPGKEQE